MSGLTWSATYNGARLKQVANSTPTTYTLDLAAPLVTALTERTGATTKQYMYGQGDPLTRAGSPLAVYSGTTWTYLSGRDGLNSVRQETDAGGNVIAVRGFDPYGVPLEGNGGAPFGYTGEMYDASTQLVFLRARYMQPALGMFLSRDPWGGDALRPGSMNGWNYVGGNPVYRTDPSGQVEDPLTPDYWRISKQEAGRFQIPTELVAGTVAVEIVHDTLLIDPLLDTFLLKLWLIVIYCPDTADTDKVAANLWLEWYNSHGLSGHAGLGPGPGVANVHVRTAREVENWFQTHYRDQNLLTQPQNFRVRLATLLTDDGNIRYSAAILRQLADQRTNILGPHAYEPPPWTIPGNLSDLDMQMIYQGFRGSIDGYYGSIDEWRQSNDPGDFGPQIAPYLPFYREKVNRGE